MVAKIFREQIRFDEPAEIECRMVYPYPLTGKMAEAMRSAQKRKRTGDGKTELTTDHRSDG